MEVYGVLLEPVPISLDFMGLRDLEAEEFLILTRTFSMNDYGLGVFVTLSSPTASPSSNKTLASSRSKSLKLSDASDFCYSDIVNFSVPI